MNDTLPYYLGFSHFLGIGPMKFDLLIKHFKSIGKAYSADFSSLRKLLGDNLAQKFVQFRREFKSQEKLEEFKKKEITVLTRADKHFPPQLLKTSDSPICLYVKGNLEHIDWQKIYSIAIVGTRKPTSYGQQVAKKFADDLASYGFIIVSGLAIGIDTVAHLGALDQRAKTIAILGCGVDIIYPPINKNLYRRIIDSGGLIMSEFPPGMTVLPGLFVARNRLISALSLGVLVVEGAADSGALITARYAAEQGKEVFAAPGPITSAMSSAPNTLLKQGAKLVTRVEDILEELHLTMVPLEKAKTEMNLDEKEKQLLNLLVSEPKLANDLAAQTNLSINQILQNLSTLEIKGVVEKNSEGKYQIKV